LNTPRAIADEGGQTIWAWPIAGNPFGEQLPQSNGYVYNLRFPGQYYDAETGLHYNMARYFDSGSGRYMQADPIGYAGGQASWYAYVDGNPVAGIDPLGLQGVMGPLPSLPPFPTELNDCQKNALANGGAQVMPFVNIAFTLSNREFTPFGDGPWSTRAPSSEWDVVSGLAGTTTSIATSNTADIFAKKYMEQSYRNLSEGNKAARRDLRWARQVMWGGSSKGLQVAGHALAPIGIISAYLGVAERARECGCGN
jgi:RHS repeat-associated protein